MVSLSEHLQPRQGPAPLKDKASVGTQSTMDVWEEEESSESSSHPAWVHSEAAASDQSSSSSVGKPNHEETTSESLLGLEESYQSSRRSWVAAEAYACEYGHCSFRPRESVTTLDQLGLTALDLSTVSATSPRQQQPQQNGDGSGSRSEGRKQPHGDCNSTRRSEERKQEKGSSTTKRKVGVAGFAQARVSTFGKNIVTIGLMMTGRCQLQVKKAQPGEEDSCNNHTTSGTESPSPFNRRDLYGVDQSVNLMDPAAEIYTAAAAPTNNKARSSSSFVNIFRGGRTSSDGATTKKQGNDSTTNNQQGTAQPQRAPQIAFV